jgi:hypothetical protein
MSGMPARLDALVDVLESSEDASSRTCLRMLERGVGPARLVFKSSGKRRRATRLSRWLAIVCLQPPLGRAASVAWVPDGRITCWAAGMPPGELHRGATGLDPGATGAVVARSQQRGGPRRFAAPGVFQAAGIVDGALLRVTRGRLRQRAWLRMTVNTRMWGRSAGARARGGCPRPSRPATYDHRFWRAPAAGHGGHEAMAVITDSGSDGIRHRGDPRSGSLAHLTAYISLVIINQI